MIEFIKAKRAVLTLKEVDPHPLLSHKDSPLDTYTIDSPKSVVQFFRRVCEAYFPTLADSFARRNFDDRESYRLQYPARAWRTGSGNAVQLSSRSFCAALETVDFVAGPGQLYFEALDSRGCRLSGWFVHDLSGTHRDEYFFSTDPHMTPQEIVEIFTGRWSIEVTFEELRAYMGLETTRGWSEKTILRMAPCLMGLYSVVALLYAALPARKAQAGAVKWQGKQTTTYSDAVTAVRRWLWREWVFERVDHHDAFSKLPSKIKECLLYALAPAA